MRQVVARGAWAWAAWVVLGAVQAAPSWALCLDPPGDINGNGTTTVVDVQCESLANLWSLGGQQGAPPGCLRDDWSPQLAADANCDRVVNVTDTVLEVMWALGLPLSETIDHDGDSCVDACQTDLDGDGVTDILDCAPLDPAVGPGPEVCNGWDDDCDGVVDGPNAAAMDASCNDGNACNGVEACGIPPSAPGVRITEVMPDPVAVPDSKGEWVEVSNPTPNDVDLRGWTLAAGGALHTIDPGGALIVPAHGRVVLAASTDRSENGGLLAHYAWTGLSLPNAMGSVALRRADGTVVDTASWGGSFPVAAGRAVARVRVDAASSDPASWALATMSYGLGDKGTPGGPNRDVAPDACLPGTPLACNDNNPCTDDGCDPATGCTYAANTAGCNDGNACTTNDHCQDSACVGGPPLDCDDGNVCTDDTCEPLVGCVHTPVSGACDDGNACTTGDHCQAGGCVGGPPPSCDDGNACTNDGCDPSTGCTHVPNAEPCDDGNACTVGDTCGGGLCQSGTLLDCDDGNVCTDDGCDPSGGCTHVNNSAPCDDGNACTTQDTCAAGSCIGGMPLDCNDGNVCTSDNCDPGWGCTHSPSGAACSDGDLCTIGDECVGTQCQPGLPRDCSDGNPCTDDACDPQAGCTHADNTAPCDDGDACTTGDHCQGGSCAGGPAPNCDDGNVCTDDACNPATGCTHANNTAACDDGDACTTGDHCQGGACLGGSAPNCDDGNGCTDDGCDPATGCTHANNTAACNDGNACTTSDHCQGGSCVGGPAPNCDDGNLCTDDACDPASGCTHANNTVPCDDGNACTTGDHCGNGTCHGGAAPNCDDGNPCTDDGCNAASGCTHVDNSVACDDGNACTSGDHCAGGQCQPGVGVDCSDGNPCTDDGCDPATGCTHANNTAACNDGNACTTGDHCQGGSCVGGPAPNCDDGNGCTDDACDPASGCTHVANAAPCSDGNACTAGDHCSGGQCQPGAAIDCNDGNPCTDDGCDPASGCTHANNAAGCNDGDACTTGDHCQGGACIGGPPPACDDGNPCTDDGCDPASGCVYTPNTAACDDGNACTTGDHCSGSQCLPGTAVDCSDGNPCTDDGCNPASGCTHANNTNPCSDNDACTVNDRCKAGVCVGGPAPNCNDGNPCTDDGCDPSTGCTHANNTVTCNDGNACTTGDHCQGGVCTSSGVTNCDDGNPCTTDSCNPQSGCLHANNTDPCNDGDACTLGDVCSGGTCTFTATKDCGDNLSCTDDACDPATGSCSHPVSAGSCLIGGTCYGVGDLNPANACQWCDPGADQTAWTARPGGTICDDNDACTLTDTCQNGQCVGSNPKPCDDGKSCTNDSCDPVTGECQHAITSGSCLIGGTCYGYASPNPANPCQWCWPPSSHTAWTAHDGVACDDGNACTQTDTCQGGQCVGSNPKPCDDGKWCTTDACTPSNGACTHTPTSGSCLIGGVCYGFASPNPNNPCQWCWPPSSQSSWTANDSGTCSDGNACTQTDTCQGGQCVGSNPKSCDDGVSCTADSCIPSTGLCLHTVASGKCLIDGTCFSKGDPKPLGGPLVDDCQVCEPSKSQTQWSDAADGTPCREPDGLQYTCWRCQGGTCTFPCDDGDPCTADRCHPTKPICDPNPPPQQCCGDGVCDFDDYCYCTADCPSCSGGCCSANGTPGCGEYTCALCVCSVDSTCCTTAWDSACVNVALNQCYSSCTCASCGDGVCSGPEDAISCPGDCGTTCGDGLCEPPDETCGTCPADCGPCFGSCLDMGCGVVGITCACDSKCLVRGDCCFDYCPECSNSCF